MRDILSSIDRWREEGQPVAIATVVETWGSAPRQAGAHMAMTASGRLAGSVSGGCVEGAVYEAAQQVLAGETPRLLSFGVADADAWEVGLACGGEIQVFVDRLDGALYALSRDLLHRDELFAVATVIAGPQELLGRQLLVQRGGRLFGDIRADLDDHLAAVARAALSGPVTARRALELPQPGAGTLEVMIQVHRPAPTMVLVGGAHIAVALSQIAQTVGYRTVVIDPRRAFGSQERFPAVWRLIQAWPEEAFRDLKLTSTTAVVLLSHDPKIDDPALKVALASPAFYVGALGSRKTHSARRQRLLDAGLSEAQLARIHAPVGLDIGARTPEEIAVAIMAEIISAERAVD
jgi:xanthine dehydrogenase accessory factor